MLAHAVVEVAELGVAIRVLGTLELLGGRLQAVAGLVQQPPHQPFAGRMALPGQRDRQLPRRLDRPAQRRLRITPGVRVDEALQRRRQRRIHRLRSFAPGTCSPYPPGIGCTAVEFVDTPVTVERAAPVARATNVIPPCPASRASTAIHSRRCRSSSTGASSAELARHLVLTIGGRHHITQNKARIPNVALIYSRVLRSLRVVLSFRLCLAVGELGRWFR